MQVVGTSKTEASQKPVHSIRFWREHCARGGFTRNTRQQATGSSPARSAKAESLLGTVSHEQSNPEGCAGGGHRQEERVAYLPPHMRYAVAGVRRRHQGCAGATPARVLPCHSGHLHPGRHRTEASSAKQDRRFGTRRGAAFSPDAPRSRTLTAMRDLAMLLLRFEFGGRLRELIKIVPFCAYEVLAKLTVYH